MPASSLSLVIQRLRRILLLRDGGMSDRKLLETFLDHHDEAAFEAIVRCHGAMVMGVCRRVLRSHHDAEDAFQATFFVFAREAASISSRESLSHWLYGVAFHAALKAKAAMAKRRLHERKGAEMPKGHTSRSDEYGDLEGVLDEELSRLPARYRAPIVLCDLEGMTRKEAAAQLRCPEGTVAGRLARARAMLAKRLTQRGVALAGAVLVGQESLSIAAARVPISLIQSTSKAAILYATGQTITTVVSAKVAALATGVVQAMFLTKLKTLAVVLLVIGLASIGGGGLLIHSSTAAPGEQKKLLEIVDKPKELSNPTEERVRFECRKGGTTSN